MRQINFRGKSIAEEWHYGLLAHSAGFPGQPDKGIYISNRAGVPYAYQVIPESIGEYIGKIDLNNTKIYEGDIVKRQGGSVYKIEYNEYEACFKLIPIIARYQIRFYELEIWDEVVTIIGNKYDNPKLLNSSTYISN